MARECRNCGSSDVLVVDQGVIAPFFAKRVHDADLSTFGQDLAARLDRLRPGPARTLGRLARSALGTTSPGRRALGHRSSVRAAIAVCRACTFVGPEREYSTAELHALYRDYRSDSYDRERTRYEPGYAAISRLVGKGEREVAARNANVDALLSRLADPSHIETVIDWGGGEGRFVPTALRGKRVVVLDVSSEQLADPAFTRVSEAPADLCADYLQACHVLEHVSSPRSLLAEMLRHARAGAYIYLEVPCDRSAAEVRRFQKADGSVRHTIHEHLNLFTVDSLRGLGHSVGLEELVIAEVPLDLGWTQATVISALLRVP